MSDRGQMNHSDKDQLFESTERDKEADGSQFAQYQLKGSLKQNGKDGLAGGHKDNMIESNGLHQIDYQRSFEDSDDNNIDNLKEYTHQDKAATLVESTIDATQTTQLQSDYQKSFENDLT